MTFKMHLMHFFKHRILAPQVNWQERWEKRVVAIPEATRGGEKSPVRFNIPHEGIKLEGDHMPLPGFPRSAPQMLGSIINIRKSIYDLEKNPAHGRKQIDADILALTPGDEWEVVGKLPMPLSSPAAAIIGGRLYVAGGSPNGSSVQGKMWVRDAPLSPEREEMR